jgi:hypothetical protein
LSADALSKDLSHSGSTINVQVPSSNTICYFFAQGNNSVN